MRPGRRCVKVTLLELTLCACESCSISGGFTSSCETIMPALTFYFLLICVQVRSVSVKATIENERMHIMRHHIIMHDRSELIFEKVITGHYKLSDESRRRCFARIV